MLGAGPDDVVAVCDRGEATILRGSEILATRSGADTLAALADALETAGVAPADLSALALIGAARHAEERVRHKFGRAEPMDDDAVAIGAATMPTPRASWTAAPPPPASGAGSWAAPPPAAAAAASAAAAAAAARRRPRVAARRSVVASPPAAGRRAVAARRRESLPAASSAVASPPPTRPARGGGLVRRRRLLAALVLSCSWRAARRRRSHPAATTTAGRARRAGRRWRTGRTRACSRRAASRTTFPRLRALRLVHRGG